MFKIFNYIRNFSIGIFNYIRNFSIGIKYPFWRYRAMKSFDDAGNCTYKTKYWTTWYNEIPEGWRKAFGKQLSKEILKAGKQCLKEHKKEHLTWDNLITWQQIKEKWGSLCLYASAVSPIMRVLEKYETLSIGYCMYCGKPARYYTKGWVSMVCEDCAAKLEKTHIVRLSENEIPKNA